eukprot:CAMPEP_0168492366 /NCGR_PEP_ID=MMETSP0228-20121227/70172_1 /TAXON_ID=133427 /ORGANISM="Protoceratium reticulatum, Strain CCCM 535 (=CCMP 1889)" /LENGTH=135 /DNA_ID=CAMNT_0008509127 /DNA_START=31 /DNA_END=439 /DNA_ORIENTATION=-
MPRPPAAAEEAVPAALALQLRHVPPPELSGGWRYAQDAAWVPAQVSPEQLKAWGLALRVQLSLRSQLRLRSHPAAHCLMQIGYHCLNALSHAPWGWGLARSWHKKHPLGALSALVAVSSCCSLLNAKRAGPQLAQ